MVPNAHKPQTVRLDKPTSPLRDESPSSFEYDDDRLSVDSETRDHEPTSTTRAWSRAQSPIQLLLYYGGLITGFFLLITLIAALAGWNGIGVVFGFLTVLSIFLMTKSLIEVATVKARAISQHKKEAVLLFGLIKLVLWEENEGLLFLKDKKISLTIYGLDPKVGGGIRYIFPILGEEVRVRVPLTLQMSKFKDHRVLTREAIQLQIHVAFWWRIRDQQGLRDFYLLIENEIHLLDDRTLRPEKAIFGENGESIKATRRSDLDAAEQWIKTLMESSLRKLVAESSIAPLLSSRAVPYLHAPQQSQTELPTDRSRLQAGSNQYPGGFQDLTPQGISRELKKMIDADTKAYGLEVERVEIQEIQLPPEVQAALDEVVKATSLPAQASLKATARKEEIKAELETVQAIVGKEAYAAGHILSQIQGASLLGGLPRPIEQLLASILTKAQTGNPALEGGTPSTSLPDSAQSGDKK